MILLPPEGRVVICGGPHVGKTTLANRLLERGFRVRGTDSLLGTHAWSDASLEVTKWFAEEPSWVVEGAAAVRALRKWLAHNPEGRPCDVAVWLDEQRSERSKGQSAMAKGCATVWREVWPELVCRGVDVQIQ